jgi:hypothetical protein
VESPVIDLQQHPENDLPKLALAVTSKEKLLQESKRPKKQEKKIPVPAAEASLLVQVKAPNGGLQVTQGKIIFPSDVGSVLGDKIMIDIGLGSFATQDNEELKEAEGKYKGQPLVASLWSETVQAQAVGFFHKNSSKVKLLKPLKAEVLCTYGSPGLVEKCFFFPSKYERFVYKVLQEVQIGVVIGSFRAYDSLRKFTTLLCLFGRWISHQLLPNFISPV